MEEEVYEIPEEEFVFYAPPAKAKTESFFDKKVVESKCEEEKPKPKRFKIEKKLGSNPFLKNDAELASKSVSVKRAPIKPKEE
jgi:hypothetical protein